MSVSHFKQIITAAILAWVLLAITRGIEPCDETVCGSIVSKCMLTQSCKCDDPVGNVTCARECFLCLDHLYSDCCTCLEMCPKPNKTEETSTKSHVEDLVESSPDLFQVLTEVDDSRYRWTVFNYPVHLALITTTSTDANETSNERIVKVGVGTNAHGGDSRPSPGGDSTIRAHQEDIFQNCTVAYMAQCMSWVKCKSACRSMGASSYRWFHDGCCECVGENCINYGINESRCLDCPLENEEDDEYQETLREVDGADDELTADKSSHHHIGNEHHRSRKSENGPHTGKAKVSNVDKSKGGA